MLQNIYKVIHLKVFTSITNHSAFSKVYNFTVWRALVCWTTAEMLLDGAETPRSEIISPHVTVFRGGCSGSLGWLSSLQPCFCSRLLRDQNSTKLSSTWPSVAMEIRGSLDCWCASTSMSQSESIIWIHLVCTPLLQTWHLRKTWCLSLTTEVLQKERKKER